jgi:hypothetical protein
VQNAFHNREPLFCAIPVFQRYRWVDVWVMTMTCFMQPRRRSLPIHNDLEQLGLTRKSGGIMIDHLSFQRQDISALRAPAISETKRESAILWIFRLLP